MSGNFTNQMVAYPLNYSKLQQMVFIYNCVMNGWKVQRLDDGRFEFEKELTCISPEEKMNGGKDVKDTFVYKFLRNHLSLEFMDQLRVLSQN